MSSGVRLSGYMKDGIRQAMLLYRFQEPLKQQCVEQAAFALEVYHDIFPANQRELMAKLPNGWLEMVTGINVRFEDGHLDKLYFSGWSCYIRPGLEAVAKGAGIDMMTNTLRRPIPFSFRGCSAVYSARHPIALKHAALGNGWSDLDTTVQDAGTKIDAALNCTTTVGGLIKLWPEAEPFAIKYLSPSATTPLPSVPVSALNAILKLPVPEKEDA